MTDVEETIERVERLYQSLTGRMPPPLDEVPYAPIPPERSPEQHVEEQLARLLEQLGPGAGPAHDTEWTPPLTVWEGREATLICLELPGVSRADVSVSVSEHALLVTGRRAAPGAEAGGELSLRISERPVGPFRRTIVLPPDAAADQIRVHLREGILEVQIPRSSRAAEPKSILVQ